MHAWVHTDLPTAHRSLLPSLMSLTDTLIFPIWFLSTAPPRAGNNTSWASPLITKDDTSLRVIFQSSPLVDRVRVGITQLPAIQCVWYIAHNDDSIVHMYMSTSGIIPMTKLPKLAKGCSSSKQKSSQRIQLWQTELFLAKFTDIYTARSDGDSGKSNCEGESVLMWLYCITHSKNICIYFFFFLSMCIGCCLCSQGKQTP